MELEEDRCTLPQCGDTGVIVWGPKVSHPKVLNHLTVLCTLLHKLPYGKPVMYLSLSKDSPGTRAGFLKSPC